MDVPGYKIQREIGRGASTRVYLGMPNTFGTSVAIKTLSPDGSRNEDERRCFLAQAEVAQSLDHPNIVRVLDVGETDDLAFLVMEYVRGGDLNRNLGSGLHMQNVLAIVKEIAAALEYAHGKGVVHGDLKPENILLNEHGTSSLADFGVAMAGDRIVTVGKNRGTLGYMSPEQVAGQGIDGRSDFFSLGVVFYLMLTGRLPFDSEFRRGNPSMRNRQPSLPIQLAAFEEVVHGLLAPDPRERLASATAIGFALDAVRVDDRVPNAVVKTEPVSTAEIVALTTRSEGAGGAMIADRSSRLRRAGTAATVLGVLCLAAAAFYLGNESGFLQRALAAMGLIENPDVVVAWQGAEALRRDPNQNLGTVVDAYRTVLAIDPRRADAQVVIDEYARQWKEDIGRLIDQGDLDTARDKLGDLADTFENDPELTSLSDRLGDRGQAAELLEQSIRLLDSSGLDDERAVDLAIVRLEEVLALHPDNPQALGTLNQVAVHYADAARKHAEAGDGPGALEAMKRAERANPAFDGVEDLRATVTDAVAAHEEAQAQFDDMLRQAAALRESGNLVEAIEMYRSVLVIQPEAPVALQGLAGTISDILVEFQSRLNEDRLNDATSLFDRAKQAGIGDDAVEEMRGLHDAELKRIADVARLIDEAESFLQEGYVTGPDPENNAVARLRDALRLDADNADGIRLQSMAATRLAGVAVEAYYAGMAEEGLEYLNLALAVTPGITRWRVRREQWQAEISRNRIAESGDAAVDGDP